MTPTEKALLLQAIAEMAKVNATNTTSGWGCYTSIRDNCKDAANLILESIKQDFKQKEK